MYKLVQLAIVLDKMNSIWSHVFYAVNIDGYETVKLHQKYVFAVC